MNIKSIPWSQSVLGVAALIFYLASVLFPFAAGVYLERLFPESMVRTVLTSLLLQTFGNAAALGWLAVNTSKNSKRFENYHLNNQSTIAIVRSMEKLLLSEHPLVVEHAKRRQDQALSALNLAASGELQYDEVQQKTVPERLAKELENELLATSLWEDNDPLGDLRPRYLGILEEKKKGNRNLVIKRLFLVKRGDEAEEQLKTRVKRDVDAKVDVRLMYRDEWQPTDCAQTPLDFGVWDGKRVWRYNTREDGGRGLRRARLLVSTATVKAYAEAFNLNFAAAKTREDFG